MNRKEDTVFCYYAHNSVWTCELGYGADTMFHRTYFLFWNKLLRKENSGSSGPIFTEFSPYGRCLIVECRFDPPSPMAQVALSWQPILGSKLAKSDYSPLFVSDFKEKNFICDDVATLCVRKLVNLGPVNPELTRVVGVHRSHLKIK